MTTLAVIPARYASTRFPGKPLYRIRGREMVLHVCDRVRAAAAIDMLTVATDDERIAAVCRADGIDVTMTADTHATGTDRLTEVAEKRPAEIYVNVQGDEPLIAPEAIDAVVNSLQNVIDRGIHVSTAYIEEASAEQKQSNSVVHLVPTLDGCVMTFSRLPVPLNFGGPYEPTVHVGLYAFTGAALRRFSEWERGPVERAENIELMRFLEHGERVACVPVQPGSIGVDHPEDIAIVEALLIAQGPSGA